MPSSATSRHMLCFGWYSFMFGGRGPAVLSNERSELSQANERHNKNIPAKVVRAPPHPLSVCHHRRHEQRRHPSAGRRVDSSLRRHRHPPSAARHGYSSAGVLQHRPQPAGGPDNPTAAGHRGRPGVAVGRGDSCRAGRGYSSVGARADSSVWSAVGGARRKTACSGRQIDK